MQFPLWLTFFAASWAISLSPGPGAVAAMGAGVNHGFARGYWLTLGLALGVLTQLAIVGIGVGALMAASATAFAVVKWLGVAYLLWLGLQQWRAPLRALQAVENGAPRAEAARRTLVLRGWGLNAVNPKGTAFMLAVVPQFIDPSRPLALQYAVIGATLVFTDLVVMAGYTALASRVLAVLKSPRQVRAMNRLFGSLFVAAAALLAAFKRA
ncbi:MAG TPA: LysE family transporter [Rubrivivax sp.]|nr:LysE family transporter [Burkholderiales bacterium]HNT39350.1 LysE family transporter [Rubrivivax sp.]